ncbi:DUF1822 family protein [Tychonema sp. LEGE 07203]|uniref:DUF1822 family protein n=1 Tax=Tychonema sp. LEGE 07203 TaxID=1828671 RepID=UPI001880307B|nr:DUF1822 family protein [Tychonema sp. LEGE 07203]MBE9094629.1 DUF1822 family protein [Tychonema sp. LEGE 07203]
MNRKELAELAEKNWHLEDLYKALGQAKKNYKQTEKAESITSNDKDNLHGILARKKSSEIAIIYNKSYGQTKNELSDRLYKYIRILLKYGQDLDIESIDIPDRLAERGFKRDSAQQHRETDRVWWRITIELDNPDNLQLQAIVQRLGSALEKPLIVQKIEQGSTLLAFESDRREYDRIEELYRSGRLGELLKVTISDLSQITQDSMLIYVRQMYENIFGEGYQPVALILTRNQRNRSRSNQENRESIQRAKQIHLGANQSVNLAIQLTPQDEEIDIKIWIEPSGDAVYLPVGLQIKVLDEFKAPVPQLQQQTGSTDNAIEIPFSVEPGERFSVKLLLEDASVTETF